MDSENSHEDSSYFSGGESFNKVTPIGRKSRAKERLPHPMPYKLQWLSENGELVVDMKVSLGITLGNYKDNISCDVVPIEAKHILLGRPWKFDRKVIHDGVSNRYFVVYLGEKVVHKPLSPREICEDQIKMRIKREEERKEKEKVEKARWKKREKEREKYETSYEGVWKWNSWRLGLDCGSKGSALLQKKKKMMMMTMKRLYRFEKEVFKTF
ncbi:hypothetical protein CR513_46940, partial [Mucuna pruriens]